MKPLKNPFLVFGYHSPAYFCDRQEETIKIIDALHNNRNLTIIAPRRIGKTGLIHHAFHQILNKEIGVAIYMDIFPTSNLNDFTKVFAESVLKSLDSDTQKTIKKIGSIIKGFRPVIRFDPVTGNPEFTVDIQPGNEDKTLKDIFNYLASSDKQCIIAIDEFQQITEYPEKRVEALLRSYIQFAPNVRFIFSGSKQKIMQEMFMSAKRPFYQSTQLLNIDVINKEEYFSFAQAYFDDINLIFKEDIFGELYDFFDGYTWYIQVVLNRLYGYRENVTSYEQILYTVDKLISESEFAFQNLLVAYSANEVRLLKAIAKEGVVIEINGGDFISKYSLKAASSVNTSLAKLLRNEMVYRSEKGYIVYDRLLSLWLSRQF